MRSFLDRPIRQKLVFGIVGTSATALLLVSIVLISYQWVTARHEMQRDLRSLTTIISANSTAALSFNDAAAAAETLTALRARPDFEE